LVTPPLNEGAVIKIRFGAIKMEKKIKVLGIT
jgi:hypothetical protein